MCATAWLQRGVYTQDVYPLVNHSSRAAFEQHVASEWGVDVSLTGIKSSPGVPADDAPLYLPSAYSLYITEAEINSIINVDYLPTV